MTYLGLRPGEKLYEELLVKTEELDKTENSMIFIERDAVKRQLLENSIRKHSLAKRDILANEYTKELKKLDDVVEQKYGNINLREVDLLPDM